MEEFNVTTGKWYSDEHGTIYTDNKIEIAQCWDDEPLSETPLITTEECLANALLMSKSKEMLEALQYFVDRVDDDTIVYIDISEKYKQLIKEATTTL